MPRCAGALRPALKTAIIAVLPIALLGLATPARAALPDLVPAQVKGGFTIPKPVTVLKHRDGKAPTASLPAASARSRQTGTSPSAYRATAADGTEVSVVPAPAAGPPKSTWVVTYVGFEDYPEAQQAFEAAVDIWERIVTSSVPIKVTATFSDLDDYVLGSASACAAYYYGIGNGTTMYPSPLADAIKGADQSVLYANAPSCDIAAEFSSNPTAGFYYGTDGLPLEDQVDFMSIVLHELGHGLGFGGSMNVSSGVGSYASPRPMVYDVFGQDASAGGKALLAYPNNSSALAAQLQDGSVFWGGAKATAANGGVRPQLYAPPNTADPYDFFDGWEQGSSFSHLDEDVYPTGDPNSLMTPYVYSQETVHNPCAVGVGMLQDMGWSASIPGAVVPSAPTSVSAGPGNARSRVQWTRPDASADPCATNTYTVTSSPGGRTCTTSGTSCEVTGLTNGQAYTFTVVGTNSAGTGTASAPSAPVTPDGTAPTVTSNAIAAVSLGNPVVTFSGTDAGSGVKDFLITYQVAPWNGGFGSPYTVSSTGTSKAFGVAKGSSFCYTIKSRDRADNLSAASARRCTTVAMDDRMLAISSGWGRQTSSAYYAGTATTIAKTGATLTRTGVKTRVISVVATKCSTCGVVGVYWNGKYLTQLSLYRSSTAHKAVIRAYDLGWTQSGTLELRALNGGRLTIDGLGLGRVDAAV